MYIKREVESQIVKSLFKGKVVVVYGARQVGKTTLVRKIADDWGQPYLYLNCDEGDVLDQLQGADNSEALKALIGDYRLVVIDEAQRVKDIGLKLKLLVDANPDQQVVATGSSSFELSNNIAEPLTGRSFEYWLFPFSVSEVLTISDQIMFKRWLNQWLIYGMYPEIFQTTLATEKGERIRYIAENYLFKDVLRFRNIKGSEYVLRLLQALALQIGNEVSFNELAALIGISRQTVADYVALLEKAFVIFRLAPYSRNARKELGKLRKIYFMDLGIRNAIINNQNELSLRDDGGRLWENFVIAEKYKQQYGLGFKSNYYFWRTYDQQEVDLVEEKGGELLGWEIKWSGKKARAPKAWRNAYQKASWQVINPDNFLEVFGLKRES